MVRLPPLGRVFMCLYEREGFQRGGAGGYVDHILVGIAFLNVQWSNEFDPVFLFFFFCFFFDGRIYQLVGAAPDIQDAELLLVRHYQHDPDQTYASSVGRFVI